MRITTLDPDDMHKPCGIEGRLRRLQASAPPLQAACWQKLLELVEHLQASDPEPELRGHIILEELILSRRQPLDPVREQEMKKFADEWNAANPMAPSTAGRFAREMLQRFPPEPGMRVRVRVDWQDYGPLRDGLPEMHYRFQIERPGKTISEDARAKDVAEAERIVREAFP